MPQKSPVGREPGPRKPAHARRAQGLGWVRAGRGVAYAPNAVRRRRGGGTYATLTFGLVLPHSRDRVHVAHCYPYGYTDLQRELAAAARDAGKAPLFSHAPLCASLAGNAVDVLTLTAPPGAPAAAPLEERRGVVLTGAARRLGAAQQPGARARCSAPANARPPCARGPRAARVHPGETNASWMMKGALAFLLGHGPEAAALRGAFVFKARARAAAGRCRTRTPAAGLAPQPGGARARALSPPSHLPPTTRSCRC